SPCMLAHKSLAFKRLQLSSFQKDPQSYIDNFYKEVGLSAQLERFKKMGSLEELEFLLNYKYSDSIIRFLLEKGVKVEVFIGLKDRITDIQALLEFFMPLVQVWQFKDCNHLLQKS
ncbi:hypothetical protein, partial [Helicobacter pylori]|uniref:hypothetical protein n=1 Tax=Helicobacter pylori TaxID=210 RepID=UPI0027388C31